MSSSNATPAASLAPDPALSDGRQSAKALEIQKGVCRLLADLGYAPLTEFTLASGRRADIAAVGPRHEILFVEIKSSLADFRADQKWPDYLDCCDAFYFAVDAAFPQEVLPADQGLILADRFGAEILRPGEIEKVAAARRKALLLRFGRAAAQRLHRLMDPDALP